MKSSSTTTAAAATLLLAASKVAAQQQVYTINPASVTNTTRAYWCGQQQAQCPLICLQTANDASTIQNDCDPAALTYACICGNGLSPNISEYSQTLPFFLCQEWGNQCVSNCNGDSTCQSACRQQHPCGAQNPTKANTSTLTMSTSTSAAASGSGSAGSAGASTTDGVFSGFAGASSTGDASSGGAAAASQTAGSAAVSYVRAAALGAGQTFGLLGVVGAMVGGFAVLL
ncbi:hypothetical protein LTR10_009301 [Elasticomyces elasticus]|nr:hypothetical protein LTR10_009301 [Elasticomyces elasticus]KAK4971600.1 hypothetical protein LTR42_007328 [Elasticomyces elasticus]